MASSSSTSSSSGGVPPSPNLGRFIEVMNKVYGDYTTAAWTPKPYAENKSRYLWTDAFGVCNYLTLYLETHQQKYLHQAQSLIRSVHDTLGKDREGHKRLGDSTDDHPLLGGLRIGKKHPEGHRDGDGQYFHYLTKWMFALNRMSLVTSDLKYNRWAIELIKAIHPHFVLDAGTTAGGKPKKRMVWKISVDRSHPVVPSAGSLDPFDGYITYRIVQNSAEDPNVLNEEIQDMKQLVMGKYKDYSSQDPLDLGEALWIAHWFSDEDWSKHITSVSLGSLDFLWRVGYFSQPLSHRLAFREFGTSLGLSVTQSAATSPHWKERIEQIHRVWTEGLWERDEDITPVMFCSSLIPGTFDRNWMEQKLQRVPTR